MTPSRAAHSWSVGLEALESLEAIELLAMQIRMATNGWRLALPLGSALDDEARAVCALTLSLERAAARLRLHLVSTNQPCGANSASRLN